MTHVLEGPATWACALSTPSRVAMRPARWMLPSCGRWSKAMSPASRPRVSGCRASWSRPCRCRQAPVHTGPLQLRRKSTRSPDLGLAASRSGPSAFLAAVPAAAQAKRERTTQQQQQVDVAQLEEHRSPKPAAGGSIPSVHANRGRSHGHRTRELVERPAKQRGTGLTVTWPWDTSPDSDPSDGE